MISPRSLLASAAIAGGVLCAHAGRAAGLEPWQIDAGYQQLLNARGSATPLAAGVDVSQVEAPEGTQQQINAGQGRYFPATTTDEFLAASDPLGQDVIFYDGSGFQANGVSAHATDSVGRWMYGNVKGVAKAARSVTAYDANRWLDQQLHYSGNQAPERARFVTPQSEEIYYKVQNHSWVFSFSPSNPTSDVSALRRYDYVIETDDITAVVGANNNPLGAGIPSLGSSHPSLFAHSYNAIVVGRTDSRHSRGVTGSVYGPGRFRPDIVSNWTSTSAATAQVSSVASVLRGVMAGNAAGDRSEVIKALLLAGATKTEFNGFDDLATPAADPRNWTHTATQPLDPIFGAGEVNIFNSYLMTVGGQNAGSTSEPGGASARYGWDYQDRKADTGVGDMFYNFVVPSGSTAPELSIILSWNVKVTDTNPSESIFTPQESLQNLDLRLYDSTASFMGTMLDQSVSTIDNVEHIYRTNLGPGTYTLKVSGAAGWDYGVAWRMSTLYDQTDADFDEDGQITGSDFLAWQRNVGKLVGATHGDGDADGDGDVDADDLSLYKTAFDNQAPPPMLQLVARAVPEPATILSAAVLGLGAWAVGRRRRSFR